MIDLFPTLLYCEKDVALELQERLATSITKIYNERAYYEDENPIKGRVWRRLGLYDSKGNHISDKKTGTTWQEKPPGEVSMEGVDGWKELRQIVHKHAIEYFKEITDYPHIAQLEHYWPVQAWWSVFDEKDDYPWHYHSQYCMIGTYYVQHEPGHAPISFRSPINALVTNTIPGTSKVKLEETIFPKTGDLLIWPPWLEHEVPGKDSYLYKKNDIQGLNKFYRDPDNEEYGKLRISISVCFLKPDIMLGYMNEKRE